MKGLPKFAFGLLFAFYFCVGFAGIFILITPYIEAYSTQSVENNPPAYFNALMFTENEVKIVNFRELGNSKSENPQFSFLVPKDREVYFEELLNRGVESDPYDIEVSQISENRQLITFTCDDIRFVYRFKYEVTDREVFPQTVMFVNFRFTSLKLFACSLGGVLTCLFFYFIHRRYFTR